MDQGEIGTRAQLFTMAPAIWNLEEHATVQSGGTKTDCRNLSPVWQGTAVFQAHFEKANNALVNTAFILFCKFAFYRIHEFLFFHFFHFFYFTARLYRLRTGLTGMHNLPLDEAPTTSE